MFGKQLEAYLAFKIHGRKPPQSEKIQPRKTPRRGPARDEDYKAWIRTLPSLVSGHTPCDAAHTGNDGGTSMKAADYSCVPLTRGEHEEYHRIGKRAFERKYRVNFARACRRLWAEWRAKRAA